MHFCIHAIFCLLLLYNDITLSINSEIVNEMGTNWNVCIVKCFIPVFDVTSEPVYMTSLLCEDTRRILDICCVQADGDGSTFVTAGLDLLVWRKVPVTRYVYFILVFGDNFFVTSYF